MKRRRPDKRKIARDEATALYPVAFVYPPGSFRLAEHKDVTRPCSRGSEFLEGVTRRFQQQKTQLRLTLGTLESPSGSVAVAASRHCGQGLPLADRDRQEARRGGQRVEALVARAGQSIACGGLGPGIVEAFAEAVQ